MLNKQVIKDYFFIILGSIMISISISNMLEPKGLVIGGVSGLAVILKELLGIELWLSNTLMNVPIFIWGMLVLGWQFVLKSLVSTVVITIAFKFLPSTSIIGDDILLAAVFGGILLGVGIGLVLKYMGSTGGTDMVAVILNKKFKHINTVRILQYIDGAIVILGVYTFGVYNTLYALISIYVILKVSENVLEGTKFAKQAFIISDKSTEISEGIMHKMNRGVTGVRAMGMYSKADKTMLYCAVSPKEIVELKELVNAIDTNAFVIVSDAREVLGEGFEE